MRNAKRLSISALAFLIGLGSSAALAQSITGHEDTLNSAAIDQAVDRDMNQNRDNNFDNGYVGQYSSNLSPAERHQIWTAQHPDQVGNYGDDTRYADGRYRHDRDNVSGSGNANAPGNLTQLGQNLRTDESSLDQARQTERQDFRQARADERTDNVTGAQTELNDARAERGTVRTDRQDLRNDLTASRDALQPELQAVRQDRATLHNDWQQTRTDRADDNTAALQQDLTNDRTARHDLHSAEATLRQDRTAVGLGNSVPINGNRDNRDNDRFAFNQGQTDIVTANSVNLNGANNNTAPSANVPASASTGVTTPATVTPVASVKPTVTAPHVIPHAGHR